MSTNSKTRTQQLIGHAIGIGEERNKGKKVGMGPSPGFSETCFEWH
jgi:hypothetical protein